MSSPLLRLVASDRGEGRISEASLREMESSPLHVFGEFGDAISWLFRKLRAERSALEESDRLFAQAQKDAEQRSVEIARLGLALEAEQKKVERVGRILEWLEPAACSHSISDGFDEDYEVCCQAARVVHQLKQAIAATEEGE